LDLGQNEQFQLHHSYANNILQLLPPSAAKAREYLLGLAERRNVYDQLLAAFVALLTIPSHGRFGTAISLRHL
jgi:hypothetical protein